jgi:hypothetical protein
MRDYDSPSIVSYANRLQSGRNPSSEYDDIMNTWVGDMPPEREGSVPGPKSSNTTTPSEFAADASSFASGVVEDIKKGVKEAPGQVIGGGLSAVQEVLNTGIDLADWGENYLVKQGYIKENRIPDNFELTFADDMVPPAESFTGRAVRGITQFTIPFLGASKLIGVGKGATRMIKLGKAAAAGAVADFAAFDPHEERLSNLVQSVPELQNPVTAYLAADKDDSAAEGRLKNAIEGLGLGVVAEGLTAGLRLTKATRRFKEAHKAEEAAQGAKELVPGSGAVSEGLEDATKQSTELAKVSKKSVSLEPVAPGDVIVANTDAAVPDKALNINLLNLDAKTDIKKLIAQVAEHPAIKKDIEAARRGIVGDEALINLADDLGFTPEQLSNRLSGQAFNAEQLVASRRLLVASADNVFELAQKARQGTALDKANLLESFNAHRIIQSHVSGAVAEAGRALRSQRLVVGLPENELKAKALKELVSHFGGEETLDQLAESILATGGKPKQLGKLVRKSLGGKLYDAAYEAWINGLLSSPTTHSVNFLSNVSLVMLKPLVRTTEGLVSKVPYLGSGEVSLREGLATVTGSIAGLRDGVALAWKTLKTGQSSDIFSKVQITPAISSGNFGLSDKNMLAGAMDAIGTIIRSPSRLLTAADDGFKAINYRAELNALAIRDSIDKGLSGKEFRDNVKSILSDPPEDLFMKAVSEARVQTLTRPLEGSFGKWDQAIKSNPYSKIVAPFTRVGFNTVDYFVERTPFAPLLSRVRNDFMKGGAARDATMGKMAFGTAGMVTVMSMAVDGSISGGGPIDYNKRKQKELSGWRPYSIRVGDTWYSYERVNPLGMLLGLAADAAELTREWDDYADGNLDEFVVGAAMLIGQTLTPEFMTEGLGKLTDALTSDRKAEAFVKSLSGSVIPNVVMGVRKSLDPIKRDTSGDPNQSLRLIDAIVANWKNKVPGLSKDLPPKLNIFGEEETYENVWSSVGESKASSDPVVNELDRLGVWSKLGTETLSSEETLALSNPPRHIAIGGQTIQLSPKQYHEYAKLCAGIGLKGAPGGKTFKEYLTDQIERGYPGLPSRLRNNDEDRKLLIKRVWSSYKGAAKAQFIQSNDQLKDQIRSLGKLEQAIKTSTEAPGRGDIRRRELQIRGGN